MLANLGNVDVYKIILLQEQNQNQILPPKQKESSKAEAGKNQNFNPSWT